MLRTAYYRLMQNYFMRPRLDQLSQALHDISARGYKFLNMAEFVEHVRHSASSDEKICILRCDVDSDAATARAMWERVQAASAKMTFYFRLCTLDAQLMRDIAASGNEVGYHFEEIATVAKRIGLRDEAAVEANMTLIRQEFARNLEQLYAPAAGAPPVTIASHGDFANRALGVPNWRLVDDDLRQRHGIVAEVYDPWLNASLDGRISDCGPPTWWRPHTLDEVLGRNPQRLYILVHPRAWRADWRINTRLDLERVYEGYLYRRRKEQNRAA
jgi:hypothetical protein